MRAMIVSRRVIVIVRMLAVRALAVMMIMRMAVRSRAVAMVVHVLADRNAAVGLAGLAFFERHLGLTATANAAHGRTPILRPSLRR